MVSVDPLYDDAKKQTYQTMLDENKLDQLIVEPPLPSK
jgi:hypothetical protein